MSTEVNSRVEASMGMLQLKASLRESNIAFHDGQDCLITSIKGSYRHFDMGIKVFSEDLVRVQAWIPLEVDDNEIVDELCDYMRKGYSESLEFGFFPANKNFCVSKYSVLSDLEEDLKSIAGICDKAAIIFECISTGREAGNFYFYDLVLMAKEQMSCA